VVEDVVTDGRYIGQLFASECAGLEENPLDRLAVTDADPDAQPSPAGTLAYRLQFEGEAFARVLLYPEAAEIHLAGDRRFPAETGAAEAIQTPEPGVLRVERGAAVKAAVDAVRSLLARESTGN